MQHRTIYFSIYIINWIFFQVFERQPNYRYQSPNLWRSFGINIFVSGLIFYNIYFLKGYKILNNLAAIPCGIPEKTDIIYVLIYIVGRFLLCRRRRIYNEFMLDIFQLSGISNVENCHQKPNFRNIGRNELSEFKIKRFNCIYKYTKYYTTY